VLPVITIVGRPNVGKSTLFNRLTRSRDALVADLPGLTRDRQYGLGRLGKRPYVVVDTGGINDSLTGVDALMWQQVRNAIEESDHVLLMFDARAGLTAADEAVAAELRHTGKPVTLVINKAENLREEFATAEFFVLGLGEPVPIAAVHGRGVTSLIERVLEGFPEDATGLETRAEADAPGIQIAVVGKPNVGKSTLVNRLLGEERVVAFDQPGTTRDSIRIPFERAGKPYTLVDTAGVRRRSRIAETIEKFSVIKTLQAMQEANVVLLVLDAQQGIAEQDATLASHVLESGRALVVVINKWDGLAVDARTRIKSEVARKLAFLEFADRCYVSARHGSGVGKLLEVVDAAYAAATIEFKTPELNRVLAHALAEHQPPSTRGRRIKLRYAHQGGKNPPTIVIHGNQTESLPAVYQRYLSGRFRRAFHLQGTPLRLEFRTGGNPYQGRRNPLTPGQKKKRERMLRHAKKRR